MKIGIVSDSHGDKEALIQAGSFLKNNENAERLLHLGDNAADTIYTEEFFSIIHKVPGTREMGYETPSVRTLVLELEGNKISLSHAVEDKAGGVDIVLYGHTHVPTAYLNNNILYLNPGHIINNDRRYPIPTFALLILNKNNVVVRFFSLGLELLEEKEFYL